MIGRRQLAGLPLAGLIGRKKRGKPVGWASNIFPLLIVYSTAGPTGFFQYSPSPGAGNLLASLTESSTDPYGNKTITGGLVNYNNSTGQATLYTSNGAFLYTGSLSAGWTITAVDLQFAPNGLATGTSLLFQEIAAPAANVAGPWIFANTLGHLSVISDTNHGDGNQYDIERLSFIATGGTLVNSLTAANVPGTPAAGTVKVAPGKYIIRGQVVVQQGAAGAGNQAVQIGGTAAVSAMGVGWQAMESATIFGSGVQTAIGGDLSTGPIPVSTTGELNFHGPLTVSTAGTLQLTARCVTSATDTWTIGFGTYFDLEPVT